MSHPPFFKLLRNSVYGGCCALTLASLHPEIVVGQVNRLRADDSLNTRVRRVGPDRNHFRIEGGVKKGKNLFHSFRDFSLRTFQSASFRPRGKTNNIFVRVTGRNPSSIRGPIRTPNGSTFYFLNPVGIRLQDNFSLSGSSSFVASTARAANFFDGTSFSTVSQNPIISSSDVTTLRFNTQSNASIVLDGLTALNVPSVKIIGNRVTGKDLNIIIPDSPEDLHLLSTNGPIRIDDSLLFNTNQNLRLLSRQSLGLVEIDQLGSKDSPILNRASKDDIYINDGFILSRSILFDGEDIRIKSWTFFSPEILGQTVTQTGTIDLIAENKIVLRGTMISSFTDDFNPIGRDINISARRLSVRDSSSIDSRVESDNLRRDLSVGNININARNIDVGMGEGGSAIRSFSNSLSSSGDITVKSDNIQLLDGGRISVSNFDRGDAGSINITGFTEDRVGRRIEISGNNVLNISRNDDLNSIDIPDEVDSLEIETGRSGIFASALQGDAGEITIETTSLDLSDSGRILAVGRDRSLFLGDVDEVGNIRILARTVNLSDGAIISVDSRGTTPGNLTISANSLSLDNARLSGDTVENRASPQDGANIILNVSDSIDLSNNSTISAAARGGSPGGNILILNTPIIRASNAVEGQDGNDIKASSESGIGGNILIRSQGSPINISELPPGSEAEGNGRNDIDASGTQSGTIEIDPIADFTQGLIELPTTVVAPDALIEQNPCSTGGESEFTLSGRSGLPQSSSNTIDGLQAQIQSILPSENTALHPSGNNTSSRNKSDRQFEPQKPMQGWTFNPKGQIQLVAHHTQATSRVDRPQIIPASCQR